MFLSPLSAGRLGGGAAPCWTIPRATYLIQARGTLRTRLYQCSEGTLAGQVDRGAAGPGKRMPAGTGSGRAPRRTGGCVRACPGKSRARQGAWKIVFRIICSRRKRQESPRLRERPFRRSLTKGTGCLCDRGPAT